MEVRDFKNNKRSGREYVTEIAVPTVAEFKKYLAKRYLEIYGPRKLCSFIQRCNGQGPWAETIVLWKKNKWEESKKYTYSKLELEFVKLQKIHRSHLRLSDDDLKRYEELLVTMDLKLMSMNDKELLKIAKEWISNIKDPVDTAAQE